MEKVLFIIILLLFSAVAWWGLFLFLRLATLD